ncbi:Short-chain dehydrogenase [Tenacibaculum litopenaei]|jgi:membrane protein YqaA with SNARE-associated domain|uniref:YqaA family protein n=1 Tax=Tenacibaculum litopenaei TaxID=396016 RepID=UPI00389544D6
MKDSKKRKKKNPTPKAKRLHVYYQRTGFYMFIWESLKKAFWPIAGVVIGLILFNKYVYNINDGLQAMTETFSRVGVLTTFFVSETLLGLIPPEIFIAWSKKTADPILNLSLLATLSYSGGIISYFIGRAALKINAVKQYLEVKMAKHLKNTSKWGGFLILVGALLPLPFSISCMTAGMIKYPFKGVVVFGLFRFLRFAIYAWAIFSMVS